MKDNGEKELPERLQLINTLNKQKSLQDVRSIDREPIQLNLWSNPRPPAWIGLLLKWVVLSLAKKMAIIVLYAQRKCSYASSAMEQTPLKNFSAKILVGNLSVELRENESCMQCFTVLPPQNKSSQQWASEVDGPSLRTYPLPILFQQLFEATNPRLGSVLLQFLLMRTNTPFQKNTNIKHCAIEWGLMLKCLPADLA